MRSLKTCFYSLVPGSVSPFGLLNDQECLVKYYLDRNAYDYREHIGVHPNACNSTVAIQKDDFIKCIEDTTMGNHKTNIIDLENLKIMEN